MQGTFERLQHSQATISHHDKLLWQDIPAC